MLPLLALAALAGVLVAIVLYWPAPPVDDEPPAEPEPDQVTWSP